MKYQSLIGICALSILLVGCQPQLRNYIKPITLHEDEIALVTAQTELTWGSGEIHLQDGVNRLAFVVRVWHPDQQKWEETSYPVTLHEHDKEIRRFAIVYDGSGKQFRFTLESSETVSQALDIVATQITNQWIQVPEQINYALDTFIPVAVIGATSSDSGAIDVTQLKEMVPEDIVAINPKATYYVAGLILSEE